MTMSYALQYVLVAGAVAFSVAGLMRTQFPEATRKLRVSAAMPLLRQGRSPLLVRIGRWIAPATAGSADACGHCSGCDGVKQ